MGKKKAADIDDLIDDVGDDKDTADTEDEAPARKAAPKKSAKKTAAPAAKSNGKKAPAVAAKKTAPAVAPKKKGKAEPAKETTAESEVRKALLKVKKEISYAAFAEANDFNIRSVRRTARLLRDSGEIQLLRDGTAVFISPAV